MKKTLILIILCVSGLLAPVLAQQQEKQLAEVLVLPFANETGKKEYDWLSTNIPDAIVDSMKDKFRFTLMTQNQFEEIVLLFPPKEPVLYHAHTDEKEIEKISKAVNADIIIYGKYTYNKADKVIIVNAFIYHRSRQKTTGNIDMNTPVTSEMFKLVDKVADSVIAHIADVAKEDAQAEKKAGKAVAHEMKTQEKKEDKIIQEKKDDKITLIKREASAGKSYRWYVGAALAGGAGYFSEKLEAGASLNVGITSSQISLWHYGASLSAIYVKGGQNTDPHFLFNDDINIIEYMLFMPLTLNGGIRIDTGFFTMQPFAGIGISVEMIKTGKDPIILEENSLREENTMLWYLDPVVTFGIRFPVALWDFYILPFAQVYGYAGKTDDGFETGFLLLLGVQCMW